MLTIIISNSTILLVTDIYNFQQDIKVIPLHGEKNKIKYKI